MTFRFIGTEAEISGSKLTSLGQPVEMDTAEANVIILGGGIGQGFAGAIALLPEEQFAEVGFTEAEIAKYAYPGARINAPEEFTAKYRAALIALHEYRMSIKEDK
jgi:hypothetical protein